MDKMNKLWQELSDYRIALNTELGEPKTRTPEKSAHFFAAFTAYIEIGRYRQEAKDKGIDPVEHFINSMHILIAQKEEAAVKNNIDSQGLRVITGMTNCYKELLGIAYRVQAQ
ncbi:MAG: hypothetical protein H9W81_16530 [Enterococcus sp.]|nr:hypothetical protein [Enterococcus sp.]